MSTIVATEHPHVRRDERGRPVVGKARLEVHVLAAYYELGVTAQELEVDYPYLSQAEILDALSYYCDHRDEIDSLIALNKPPLEATVDAR